MTSTVLERDTSTSTSDKLQRRPRAIDWQRAGFWGLLAATAVLYLWGLGSNGWANSFYSAAVQAGSSDWKAMLFGSSDAANAITVDKTPAALWVMDISARLFGFNAWSVLVPQALEGVGAVALLYAVVRRVAGPGAGLIAGSVLALTPVAVLMFRFDNPDALLVLLLVAAAYCVMRAVEKDSSGWWLPLAGAAVGFGFLAKMMQAFLVLPVFVAVYLLAGHSPLRRRIAYLFGALAAMIAAGGWFIAVVALWPAGSRPYIGGSQENSILELALGYNGVGRLTGDETGGLGNLNQDVGWGRLFGSDMGGDISWLLPAAVIAILAALVITRRAPRTDVTRAALVLWGGWLLVTGVVFSYAAGIVHGYYTVALAPAVAGGLGVGAVVLWRRRSELWVSTALAGMVLVTTVLSCVLLARNSDWQSWLRPTIAVVGVFAALGILFVGRLNEHAAKAVLAAALAVCLAGPAASSIATASTGHSGAIPSAGPSSSGMGMGRPPGGDGGGHGGGMGGLLGTVDVGSQLSAALTTDADQFTWAAATIGSNNAAGYQLASREPIMAVGGFNGTDPAPTLAQFQEDVSAHRIHYFLGGEMMGGMRSGSSGSQDASAIAAWVAANYTSSTIDGVTVYDLST
ncbi:ArnT family glycosyltransferase [Antrihabitans cavernicola]|uniref:ArnT family glycosyltransferase n=1 Tax=Antrihabitans cavernicola TaxID=2495913 RepID=UPI0035300065